MEENKKIVEPFKKYKVLYLIKSDKNVNLTYILDRIRGIKNVIIANTVQNDRLEDISSRNENYEFHLLKIKFITNLSASERAEEIKDIIMKGEDGEGKIKGVALVKTKIDTLEKTT